MCVDVCGCEYVRGCEFDRFHIHIHKHTLPLSYPMWISHPHTSNYTCLSHMSISHIYLTWAHDMPHMSISHVYLMWCGSPPMWISHPHTSNYTHLSHTSISHEPMTCLTCPSCMSISHVYLSLSHMMRISHPHVRSTHVDLTCVDVRSTSHIHRCEMFASHIHTDPITHPISHVYLTCLSHTSISHEPMTCLTCLSHMSISCVVDLPPCGSHIHTHPITHPISHIYLTWAHDMPHMSISHVYLTCLSLSISHDVDLTSTCATHV